MCLSSGAFIKDESRAHELLPSAQMENVTIAVPDHTVIIVRQYNDVSSNKLCILKCPPPPSFTSYWTEVKQHQRES